MGDFDYLNPLFQGTLLDQYGDVFRSQPRSGPPSELEKAYGKLDEELGGYLPGGAESPLGRFSRGTQQAFDRAYGQLDKNVFGGYLPGGAESLYGKVRRQVGDVPASAPVAEQTLPVTSQVENTAQQTPAAQPTSPLPGNQTANTTGQLGGLTDLLRTQLEQQGARFDRTTSPEFLDDQLRRRKEELRYATDILSKAQMGQMKEKTRRDVIDGWRKIQQEKIRANTVMATAMMNTAYLAATPNANVLSALNVASDSAMRAFQPGQAVN